MRLGSVLEFIARFRIVMSVVSFYGCVFVGWGGVWSLTDIFICVSERKLRVFSGGQMAEGFSRDVYDVKVATGRLVIGSVDKRGTRCL